MKIQAKSIVLLNNVLGVVLGGASIYLPDLIYNVDCGTEGIKTASYNELRVVNTNYVNSTMTSSEVYKHFEEGYTPLAKLADNAINEIAKAAQNNLNRQTTIINEQLLKDSSKIKIDNKERIFYFGGLYNSDVLVLTVKLEDNKRIFLVGAYLISEQSVQELDARVNTTVAGMKLNPDTLKWGKAIGYVQDIQQAIDYYTSI